MFEDLCQSLRMEERPFASFWQYACVYSAPICLAISAALHFGWLRPGPLMGYSARGQLFLGLGLGMIPLSVYFGFIHARVPQLSAQVAFLLLFILGLRTQSRAQRAAQQSEV